MKMPGTHELRHTGMAPHPFWAPLSRIREILFTGVGYLVQVKQLCIQHLRNPMAESLSLSMRGITTLIIISHHQMDRAAVFLINFQNLRSVSRLWPGETM